VTRIALVPGCLALLPEYASLEDPVAPLRAACLAAVAWLGPEVRVLADEQGSRVAGSLLAGRATSGSLGSSAGSGEDSLLVVGNGSACRSVSAPGYLDERAEPFDAGLGRALAGPAPDALAAIDQHLADRLWASTTALPELAAELRGAGTVAVDYDDAPFGVQYWVMRWQR
jgi:hypothetical protein